MQCPYAGMQIRRAVGRQVMRETNRQGSKQRGRRVAGKETGIQSYQWGGRGGERARQKENVHCSSKGSRADRIRDEG